MKSEGKIRERMEMYRQMDTAVGLSTAQKCRMRELSWVLENNDD